MSENNQFDLFLLGKDLNAYKFMGAHLIKDTNNRVIATKFSVYAPHAKMVRLISSFNNFDGTNHVLSKVDDRGLFSITIPENLEWVVYKYEIHTFDGKILYKTDPFGFFAEERPNNASKVYDINGYKWSDDKWMNNKEKLYDKPVLIYEMHLGSWQRKYSEFKKYGELADELISYLKYNNFTHVEFMPVYEHPLDDSWGYQGTGFFAATSRYGSPKDLMYFIDQCHQHGIGVIIDWVLGHINKDSFGLFKFDGTYLYEYEDEKRRENITWGTANLDFNKGITKSFMMSALTFWMDYFHVDGFRIDAVSHLFYYLGDQSNGINHEAISFLKEISAHVFKKDDRFILSAEDSTAFPLVTKPTGNGGVGFNYKWNMGFMNDVLAYFKLDPIHRKYHHDKLTFGLVYAFNEQFILPFSHDEVVHLKGSLISKMPGSYEEKFAHYKNLLTFYMTHPGKKLLFMGQEFGQIAEWDFKKELDWTLLKFPIHDALNRYFKDLSGVYRHHNALFEKDHDPSGFKWLIVDHKDTSVFAYARHSEHETLVVIHNLTPNYYDVYEVGVPFEGTYEEILNSNKDIYNGNNLYNGLPLKTYNEVRNNQPYFIKVQLAGLTSIILKYKK